MAKKKKADEEEDLPKGKVDEEGDEIIDLDEWDDNLDEDVYEDLSEIEDDMLTDETEDEEFGPEVDEVEKMLRKIKCDPCPGLSSKPGCQVAKDFGCPKPNK
ncbi:MAG: hypothetical protein BAJALOKI3v1_700003 [Promethearchaeota archaeon]|jgi:hypothetical protein|nr:MAG: hypothetical protein BAJALOKI3v1_700003 [Candidatus Lokiarchaeota archaeon]